MKMSRLQAPHRRFLQRDEGVAAIEFGLVAAPFFALSIAIMEAGLNFYSAASLDTALRAATRSMQVGAAQSDAMTQSEFRADLCGRLPGLMTCDRVRFDINRIAANRLDDTLRLSADGLAGDLPRPSFDQTRNRFCAGRAGDYVLARAIYELPTLFSFAMTTKVRNGRANAYIVEAARVFRNEPFMKGRRTC